MKAGHLFEMPGQYDHALIPVRKPHWRHFRFLDLTRFRASFSAI
jgi:hypothetical protein